MSYSNRPDSLAAIVSDYLDQCTLAAEDERRWFGSPALSVEEAITRAASSLCPSRVSGALRMHPHQCRVGHDRMAMVAAALQGTAPLIERMTEFEKIHALVRSRAGHIDGIGDLAIYDVAHRIGMRLGVHPRLVHLHCGARAGAAALGLGKGCKVLAPEAFPLELRTLRAEQIEDLLCIYADRLAALNSGSSADSRAKSCLASPTSPVGDTRLSRCAAGADPPPLVLRIPCLIK